MKHRILLVNDDIEDSISMQERFSKKQVKVDVVTQSRAKLMEKFDYDIIVIDNDANDLKQAKGPETLEAAMWAGTKAKIYYTSFQPGWVSDNVYRTKGVQVVKTDEFLSVVAKDFGLEIKPAKKKTVGQPEITIMVTYNTVYGYPEGVYCNGKLIILSFDKDAQDRAQAVVREKLREIYKTFEWRADRDMIKNIFVYDGLNGRKWPGRMAAALGHDIRMKVQLLVCTCDSERKRRFVNTHYVDMYEVNCGGQAELALIADMVLGIMQPGRDYSNVPVPRKIIENGAEKFEI